MQWRAPKVLPLPLYGLRPVPDRAVLLPAGWRPLLKARALPVEFRSMRQESPVCAMSLVFLGSVRLKNTKGPVAIRSHLGTIGGG